MAETEFYKNGTVLVTNSRAVMTGKTYSLANVTSVRKVVMPVNYMPIAGMILLGIVLASTGFGSMRSTAVGVVGVLLVAAGIALAFILKPTYAVRLGSASGEIDGIADKDSAEIDRIVDAISNAIVHRG